MLDGAAVGCAVGSELGITEEGRAEVAKL